MSYYENQATLYRESDSATRAKSREYWTRIHAENLKSNRHDLIIFSAQILANIVTIDAEERKKEVSAFVASMQYGEEHATMTAEEAAYTILQWQQEGFCYPSGLTAEEYAQTWNSMINC